MFFWQNLKKTFFNLFDSSQTFFDIIIESFFCSFLVVASLNRNYIIFEMPRFKKLKSLPTEFFLNY